MQPVGRDFGYMAGAMWDRLRAVLLAGATDTNPADLRSSRSAAQVLLALPCRASWITAATSVPRKASDITVALLADADPSFFFPAAAVCPWRQAWPRANCRPDW